MSDNVRKEIERTNLEFSERFARGDFEGVSALYTENALFLPAGQAIARGREQIRDTFASYAGAGITDVRFETLDVEEHGEMVLELARSTVYKGSEQVRQSYYTIAWDRGSDGVLRLHWDVVSTSHER